jgi:hypothetical protein
MPLVRIDRREEKCPAPPRFDRHPLGVSNRSDPCVFFEIRIDGALLLISDSALYKAIADKSDRRQSASAR